MPDIKENKRLFLIRAEAIYLRVYNRKAEPEEKVLNKLNTTIYNESARFRLIDIPQVRTIQELCIMNDPDIDRKEMLAIKDTLVKHIQNLSDADCKRVRMFVSGFIHEYRKYIKTIDSLSVQINQAITAYTQYADSLYGIYGNSGKYSSLESGILTKNQCLETSIEKYSQSLQELISTHFKEFPPIIL